MLKKKKILFLCTGNSCRSQMAEAWVRHLRSSEFDVCSAGIATHGLNPYAKLVMEEVGVDMSHAFSKLLSEIDMDSLDVCISVCSHADQNCPILPAKIEKIHYGFDDPPSLTKGYESESDTLVVYRRVRDEIRDFVKNFYF